MYETVTRFDSPPAIHVTGVGRATYVPDRARVVLRVDLEGRDLAGLARENAERLAAVIARLAALGIAERDRQTAGFRVAPRYDRKLERHDGYTVGNGVRVTTRDLARLGEVLGAGLAAGATGASDVAFDLSDERHEEALRRAREGAIRDARAKAEHYAALTGVTLGAAILVVEDQGAAGGPRRYALYERDASLSAPAGVGSMPIEAGEDELVVTVAVAFRID
ncbi:MAG TPA: SIMPL domain-containing protein [Thermomicrobiales bacterium]|nr:SIMPL domain-containing protein [Thermomicrobiales bacterium]